MSNNQTMAFTPGTLVWVKIHDQIWWPCRIVDHTTAPAPIQKYMLREKNSKALVYFESDGKYDIIFNMDKIVLYGNEQKQEFVKEGYSLYLKEKKCEKTQNLEMVDFVKDVIKYEEEINGDVNIFKQFEEEDEKHPPYQELPKDLFDFGETSSNEQECITNSNNAIDAEKHFTTESLKSIAQDLSIEYIQEIPSSSEDDSLRVILEDANEEEKESNEEFINHIINTDQWHEGLHSNDQTETNQLPERTSSEERLMFEVDLIHDRCTIKKYFPMHIAIQRRKDSSTPKFQKRVLLPAVLPLTDNEEDITNWDKYQSLLGKFYPDWLNSPDDPNATN